MGRPSIDTLSQTRLTLELKRAIDRARYAYDERSSTIIHIGEFTAGVEALERLVQQNRVASLRPHVLHNLGSSRRRFLGRHLTTRHDIAEHLQRMSE